MKQVAGVWLPDWEAALLPALAARPPGSLGDEAEAVVEAALALCKARRRAVDVGAHVGLWSRRLAERFASVIAVEPLSVHRACFARNVAVPRVLLLPGALGAVSGRTGMRTAAASSAESWVAGRGALPLRRYDDLGLDALPVDLMKLACEGGELFALQGAERMLRRDRPVVIVAQAPGKARRYGLDDEAAVAWLQGLGARLRLRVGGRCLLSW